MSLNTNRSPLVGTSISAWAAINGSNINTDIIYALDDGIPTLHTVESETADVTLSHQNIFTIDSLSITTNHTIEITILTQTNSSNFLFDYFLIETASNFSIKNSPASVLLIDDTSPYLEYSSEADWTNNTPYLNPDWPQDNNVMNASSKGAMKEGATLSFSFTGPFTDHSQVFFILAYADVFNFLWSRVGGHCVWDILK